MSDGKEARPGRLRVWLTEGFNHAEDIVYVGLGLLLTAAAFALLITEGFYFGHYVFAGSLPENTVSLLDRILPIVIFVELLYTVQVSFRQHILQPEPFIVVGLIAVTRRILVLTAEMAKMAKENGAGFRDAMIELALLTALILALVVSLRILRKKEQEAP